MKPLMHFLVQHGYWVLFLNVFIEQLGAPIPAIPLLMAMGALAGSGEFSFAMALAGSVAAAMAADLTWFHLGRRDGIRVLNRLCRISLEPDSCITRTQTTFDNLGPKALLVAKFVPGLSTMATPMAGLNGMSLGMFVLLDAAGSVFWAATALGLGYMFRAQIEDLAADAERFGSASVVMAVLTVGAYFGWKFYQRRRFVRNLRGARIGPDELMAKLESGEKVTIVDLRSAMEQLGARLPGALLLRASEIEVHMAEIPLDRDVILYCNCPNEATAAKVAMHLNRLGITRVRPLLGGYDEWVRRGYPVESPIQV